MNALRANLKKKAVARLVLYSELSKYYTKEEIDQMLATISEGGFIDLKSYVKKSEVDQTPTENSENPVSSGGVYSALQNISTMIINLSHRIEELERKVAYYHPEGVSITVSPQRITLGGQATIDIDVATTSDASTVEVYRVDHNTYKLVGRSSEVGRSWSFTDDVDAPQDTESLVYRVEAAIGSDLKTAEARVTVEDNKKTVQIGCGQDYASVVFEDTGSKLVNNMPVTFVPNDGDYLFIKVDKNDTVRNLYTNPAQGPDYEIPIDGGTVDGDYKYYKSTIQVTAGNMNCKINKSL